MNTRTRKWGNSIGWSWNGQSASSLPSSCLRPRVAVPLTQLTWFQVPLLQVVLPRVLPAHPVCLQAALPGTAVHEHHPQTETVQVQRVRMADGSLKKERSVCPTQWKAEEMRTTSTLGCSHILWIVLSLKKNKPHNWWRGFLYVGRLGWATSINEPHATGEVPMIQTRVKSLVHVPNLIHKWMWTKG